MKTKKIIDLCKKQNVLILIDDKNSEFQWVSDGQAIYPLLGLPEFSLTQLCMTYDIDTKKQDKMNLQVWNTLPKTFDFSDEGDNIKELCNNVDFGFAFEESSALPIKTKDGISFIDKKYLAPLSDVRDELRIYSRYDVSGRMYFVLKVGFMLYGIVTPMKNIVTERFIGELERVTELCKETMKNKTNIVEGVEE